VNAQILIDALVQQVTVLIAQVATSGGLRAPIAHIANQVFVDLSLELEAQGVGRKVSADMFGMALRAYQRKLRRLSTRASQREQTLWSGVLEALEAGALSRKALLERFARDDGRSVRAVVRDLVDAGLVRASGQGTRVTYALAREHAANAAAGRGFEELLWALVHRGGPTGPDALADRLRLPHAIVASTLQRLHERGRLELRDGRYETHDFSVPLNAPSGWEAAVLDHVQAVVQTICQRLLVGPVVPGGGEAVGGSTYRYDVWEGHPLLGEVQATLARFRDEHSRLRARVEAYNRAHGRPRRFRQVVVYGGQCSYERERAEKGTTR
jgi:hypothetical protein